MPGYFADISVGKFSFVRNIHLNFLSKLKMFCLTFCKDLLYSQVI